MRKDEFKNSIQNDLTARDLGCKYSCKPRHSGKLKQLLHGSARNKMKTTINNHANG